jgi:hypothetical protein
MDKIKRLVREVLSTPPSKKKDKCNCGCHSCKNVGNKGPVLNESLEARIVMTENMKYHVENKVALTENTFRYGSDAFLDLWAEARYLFSRNAIHVNDNDKEILLETNLGEYGIYEGKKVPLDLPMLENKEDSRSFILPYESLLKQIKKDADSHKEEEGKLMDLYYEIEQAIFDKNIPQILSILRKYGLYGKYSTLLNINESDKKKTPALNKPKRGGSKKFYVYVRDPKTKRIKKVSFGAPGMSVGFKNPKRRKAFAARHKCAQKTDRTKPSYWSCRVGRYAKQLGLGNNFSGFW